MVQIVKSQCPMNREFPVVFKTHPTFICGLIFKASRSLQTKPDMLSCGSCSWDHTDKVPGHPLPQLLRGDMDSDEQSYREIPPRPVQKHGLHHLRHQGSHQMDQRPRGLGPAQHHGGGRQNEDQLHEHTLWGKGDTKLKEMLQEEHRLNPGNSMISCVDKLCWQ